MIWLLLLLTMLLIPTLAGISLWWKARQETPAQLNERRPREPSAR